MKISVCELLATKMTSLFCVTTMPRRLSLCHCSGPPLWQAESCVFKMARADCFRHASSLAVWREGAKSSFVIHVYAVYRGSALMCIVCLPPILVVVLLTRCNKTKIFRIVATSCDLYQKLSMVLKSGP